MGYYDNVRLDLISLVQGKNNKILEVGCGTGNTGKFLKETGIANYVVGIEVNVEVARVAALNLDAVIPTDIESCKESFDRSFDYIILGDVLEHLQDPICVLKVLNGWLKDGKYIIVSVPNVRHHSVVLKLVMQGKWNYEERGILDVTHLRFFTRSSLVQILKDSYFSIIKVYPIFNLNPRKRRLPFVLNLLTLGFFKEFLTDQWVLIAKKIDVPDGEKT